jgi:hypothetical protein
MRLRHAQRMWGRLGIRMKTKKDDSSSSEKKKKKK